MWQDYAFTISAIIFGYGLIPQIKKNIELEDASFISWQLCIIYTIAISITGYTCYSLKMYVSCLANLFQLICWIIIMLQKVEYRMRKENETTITIK